MEIKTVLKAEIVKKYRTLGRRRIVAGYAAIISDLIGHGPTPREAAEDLQAQVQANAKYRTAHTWNSHGFTIVVAPALNGWFTIIASDQHDVSQSLPVGDATSDWVPILDAAKLHVAESLWPDLGAYMIGATLPENLKNELANWIVWQDSYDTLLEQEGKEAAEEWRNSLSSIQVAPAAVEAQLKLIRNGGF